MKEPQLFNPPTEEDKEVIKFDEDTIKIFEEKCKKFAELLGLTRYLITQCKELTVNDRKTHMSLAESYLSDICETIGFATPHQQKVEELYAKIRQLNAENRELRRQLGDKVTLEDAREKMKLIAKGFQQWWGKAGFGWVDDFSFTEYGTIKATLSCQVGYTCRDETEEEYAKRLTEYGFNIIEAGDREDIYPTPDANNFALLEKLCKSLCPDCKIGDVKIRTGWHGYTPYIDEFEFRLKTLDCLEPWIEDYKKEEAETNKNSTENPHKS